MKNDKTFIVKKLDSGFVEFSCFGGLGCPQIKREKDKVILRSSLNINEKVTFTNEEWDILKLAIDNKEQAI